MSTAKCHACGEVYQILFGNGHCCLFVLRILYVYHITQRERRKKQFQCVLRIVKIMWLTNKRCAKRVSSYRAVNKLSVTCLFARC